MMNKKLSTAIDAVKCAQTAGKLPKSLKTASDFNTACFCLNELVKTGKTSFVQSDVKDFFVKCGLDVEAKGIGWQVRA